ncbi:hypothetical protein DSL72_002566 [Monilinia vaccinii-corymbosi]|uniref:Cytochrome P450 n=1 Tax=Monilinia vaccinii-corymbosi TaxID=61207 RepID=A0A8A3PCV0_9HELO|nr:hypothetical protein DSL72_002566 [Monilinia vaccinii-corymbosi]
MLFFTVDVHSALNLLVTTIIASIAYRIIYNLYFHPLAKFHGPWYTACSSLPLAIISAKRDEHRWLHHLMKKYGRNAPIRVGPEMLLFPKPSALGDIYWDKSLDNKSSFYNTGCLGPPHLFNTLSAGDHTPLRKALGAAPWAIGDLRHDWEDMIDIQVLLFTKIMTEKAKAGESIGLGDRLAEFAADFMTIFAFNQPWGFVENSRDERHLLHSWREGLDFSGFAARFTFFRKHILNLPGLASWLLPQTSNHSGMGYLIKQAESQIRDREYEISQGVYPAKADFLQHCLDARINGEPLTAMQKQAHVTLLIQAGADTTGTALGAILRFLATTPGCYAKAQDEIRAAEEKNLLSTPIKDQETRAHLPYVVGAVKEGLRLHPSAPNWFPRVVPPEGKIIDGFFVPGGVDVSSNALIVQRDPDLFGPDPDSFRPERWMAEGKDVELERGMFVWGFGRRVCLGKDIAWMEMFKLIPEIVRHFEVEVLNEGKYVCAGGVSYNENFIVKLHPRAL